MTYEQARAATLAQLRPDERISRVFLSTNGWIATIYSVYTGLTRRIELA